MYVCPNVLDVGGNLNMKRILAILLALAMVFTLAACGEKKEEKAAVVAPAGFEGMEDLIAAAQAEGTLVVYGACEEEYLAAACKNFEATYGIKVSYQRLSTGEVQAKIEEENGITILTKFLGVFGVFERIEPFDEEENSNTSSN